MTADEIRKIRHGLGVNRETFGELIGVKGRTVEAYEQVSRQRSPSKAVIKNIKRVKMLNDKGALRI